MGLSGQNFCSPLCLWRNWLMSSSKFCRRNQEFAEPLCSHRNPDCKATQLDMAGFGCSPTKKPFSATNLPSKNRRKKVWWKGLPHTQAVWGWPNTRVKQMREPKWHCSALHSFPCTNHWKCRNRDQINFVCCLWMLSLSGVYQPRHNAIWNDFQLHPLVCEWENIWLKKSNLNFCIKSCPTSPFIHEDI